MTAAAVEIATYGKPAETLEDAPEDIDPFHLAEMTQAERARLVARVVAAYPQLAELVRASLHSVGDGR